MADQYTEVKRVSFAQNLINSVIGVGLGILLFVAAFPVLWINEGRINLAKVAQESVPIRAAAVQSAADGKLVAAAGTLSSTDTVGDAEFLRAGPYLALERTVEMYAWVEKESTTTTKNTGGSSTQKTTYTYEKQWTTRPENSSSFKVPGGHENPKLPFEQAEWKVRAATLGAYTVDPADLLLPDAQALPLTDEMVVTGGTWQRNGDFIVNSSTALNTPKVGDVRVSFAVVPNNIGVTLFGKASGNQIIAYDTDNAHLFRAFTENREGAIATLNTEYTIALWIIRLIGFMMMWIGLMLGIGPINTLLDVLPFLGNLSRFLTGVALFGIALLLTIITVLLSIIAHNIFLLLGLLALIVGGAIAWSRLRKPKMAAMPA